MAFTIENNQPSAGCIRWKSLNMQYKGQNYAITDGYANAIYLYWTPTTPNNLVATNTFPTLGNDDCLIFLNKSGTAVTVPTSTVLNGDLIVPSSILANAIASNTITGDKIKADTITATNLAVGAVTAKSMAVDAVGAGVISAGVITGDRLVVDTITAREIASRTITANEILAGTITANEIKAGTITATQIQAGTITATEIKAGSITADKLVAGTITGNMINGGVITGATLKTDTVDYISVEKSKVRGFNGTTQCFELGIGLIGSYNLPYLWFNQSVAQGNGFRGFSMTAGGELEAYIDSIQTDLLIYNDFKVYGFSQFSNDITCTRVIAVGNGNEFYQTGFEVRGNGNANTIYPSIGFHQPTQYAGTIQLRGEGEFQFYKQGNVLGNITANKIKAYDWLRTIGDCGWYNETYGGGIYMTDSTWVRVSHGRNFWCGNTIQADVSLNTPELHTWNTYQTFTNPYGNVQFGATTGEYTDITTSKTKFYIGRSIYIEGQCKPIGNNVYYSGDSSQAWKGCYAYAFVNNSDRNIKENITKADTSYAYETIKNINTYNYNYKDDDRVMMGLIADEVPMELIDTDQFKGIDIYNMATMTISALQESISKIEMLEEQISSIENKMLKMEQYILSIGGVI